MTTPLLDVKNLNVTFVIGGQRLEICQDISFTLDRGQVLGVIGESGSGKTVATKAILGLLPDNAVVEADAIMFNGRDISRLPPDEFDRLRGSELAMIFQDPVGSFNPVKTIGWHFRNVVSRRRGDTLTAEQGHVEAMATLHQVDIADPDAVLRKYPHQLSGGMLQRCLIALVLFCQPSLIVADEPTTNLDNLVERQTIKLLERLRSEIDASFIFITHDMTIAEQVSDQVLVMYAGQIVEYGDTTQLMRNPHHPYTRGLVNTARELEGDVTVLTEIAGEGATGFWPADQCRFAPRCPLHGSECDMAVPLLDAPDGSAVRCVKAGLTGATT